MNEADATVWLGRLLSANNQGAVLEAHTYGLLYERGFEFTAPHQVDGRHSYASSPAPPIDLDGCFDSDHIVSFDVKSLVDPGGMLGKLIDEVNAELQADGLVVSWTSPLDFDHRVLQSNYGQFKKLILNGAKSPRKAPISLPAISARVVVSKRPSKGIIFDEGAFNPYRYAEANRHIVFTHANQIPRTGRFMFIYVYGVPWTEFARDFYQPDILERALARRFFFEFHMSTLAASKYCDDLEPSTKLQDLARSVGAICFANLTNVKKPTLQLYANPFANDAQRLDHTQVERLMDFDLRRFDLCEFFEYDTY